MGAADPNQNPPLDNTQNAVLENENAQKVSSLDFNSQSSLCPQLNHV